MARNIDEMMQKFKHHVLKDKDIIIYDLETTGFNRIKDRITSFSAIKTRFDIKTGTFKEIDRINLYLNPEISIPCQVSQITGITNSFVKDCPNEEDAKGIIFNFLGLQPYLLGKNNNAFDDIFLQNMAERVDVPFQPCDTFDIEPFGKILVGKRMPNYQLSTYAKYFQIDTTGLRAHESISDVIMTMHVCEELIRIYTGVKTIEEYDNIYKQSNQNLDSDLCNHNDTIKSSKCKDFYRPQITGISKWEKNGLSRYYINTTDSDIKIWYDIKTKKWGSKFIGEFGNEKQIDFDWIKEQVRDKIQ